LIAADAVRQHEGVGDPLAETRPRRVAARLLGLVLLALAGSAAAQPAGIISGVVLDATTQAPLAGAVIAARSPALLGEQSTVTDDAGAFEMTMLPPGSYALAVQHEGFLPVSTEGLAVRGRRLKIRLQLVPEPRPPAPPPAPVALEFDAASMVGPAMISGPEPEYTQEAVERGVQGQMTVRCVIAHDGSVRNCRVIKGLPFMNASVLDALQRRRYQPATAQGKPVDVFYTFNLRLALPR
jgi:TonB family protein